MQAALEKTDDEGMAGDAGAQVIRERSREILAGSGADGFAGSKPDESARFEALAKCGEARKTGVRVRKTPAIETFAVDQRPPPLAVAPKLKLADRSPGVVRR